MKDLTLSVWTLQNNISPSITENIWSQFLLITSTNFLQPNNSTFLSQFEWLEKVTKCSYCWVLDYYLKWHCQVFEDNLNSNQIYMRNNSKISLGLYTPGAKYVFIRQKKTETEVNSWYQKVLLSL